MDAESKKAEEKSVCGLIMPISSIDGCDERHWQDVKDILSSAIQSAGFEPNLVSNDLDVGVIHKRIVQNLYSNQIVVCDVSGKNPNVMFELGMRLAFDKPVVIVKDDKTPYSFDTSPVEHLTYPRDLRFSLINEFQSLLSSKIKSSSQQKNSFLGSFGTFKVAELKEESAGALEIILEEIAGIKQGFRLLEERTLGNQERRSSDEKRFIDEEYRKLQANTVRFPQAIPADSRTITFIAKGSREARERFQNKIKEAPDMLIVSRRSIEPTRDHYQVRVSRIGSVEDAHMRITRIDPRVEIELIDIS